ncbi:hypothetical protein Fcan01_15878 [Folsomia candida]|uniref:Uncharacterized protein n=1 Tax=Folsomia candida TaxID=158441 RepID=A0A226DWD4_FOLCA|nr:hypothetical protein Fcan01_15878 [Folsomia candida]
MAAAYEMSHQQQTSKRGGQIFLQHCTVDPGHPHFPEFICKHQFGQVYFPYLHEVVNHASNYLDIASMQDITWHGERTYRQFVDMLDTNREKMEAFVGPKVWRALRISYALPLAGLKFRRMKIYHTVLIRKVDRDKFRKKW